MNEPYRMTAVELRREIHEKRIGIQELTQMYLQRIEKYDGVNGLNTISELDLSVMEQAKMMDSQPHHRDLPLYGLPVLVKDNIDVAGLHTTAGSLSLADNIASKDAPIIANLRRNGALILGKTNMTEFANFVTDDMPNGYSSKGGQVRNAYDGTKDPGGSSTGSAVAVSAGLCAAAVGTDTCFSVIGCAALNGVTGLKPPHGALSVKGIVPISHTLDSAGALTHDFSDALMLYSGMRDCPLSAVTPIKPSELRLAVNTYERSEVTEAQLGRYDVLFHALREAGASFSTVEHAHSSYQGDIMHCEFKHDVEEYLASSSARLKTFAEIVSYYEHDPERMMKYGITILRSALNETSGKLDDLPYIKAMEERQKQRVRIFESLRDYDACVMTGPTNIMHFTGLPSIALNLCMAEDHMPRSVILYGTDENRLYKAALTIEKYCSQITFPNL